MAHVSTEDRSVQFIEAAVQVIARQGVAKATTRRIAEAANAPLASLHYCFRDKDGLYLAVFEHLAAEATQLFSAIEPVALDVTAAQLFRQAARWAMGHEDYAVAQLDLYLWMVRHRPVLAADSAAVYLKAVAEVLQAAGPHVHKDAIELLASVLMGAMDGLVVQWAAERDRAQAESYVNTFCAGIPALCEHVAQLRPQGRR